VINNHCSRHDFETIKHSQTFIPLFSFFVHVHRVGTPAYWMLMSVTKEFQRRITDYCGTIKG